MNVDEARGVCRDSTRYYVLVRFTVSAYSIEKRREFMYVCILRGTYCGRVDAHDRFFS